MTLRSILHELSFFLWILLWKFVRKMCWMRSVHVGDGGTNRPWIPHLCSKPAKCHSTLANPTSQLPNIILIEKNSAILGRTVKNEYLALGVFGITFGSAYLVMGGGGNKSSASSARPTTVVQAKESVPVNASSAWVCEFLVLRLAHVVLFYREEEQLWAFFLPFSFPPSRVDFILLYQYQKIHSGGWEVRNWTLTRIFFIQIHRVFFLLTRTQWATSSPSLPFSTFFLNRQSKKLLCTTQQTMNLSSLFSVYSGVFTFP